MPFAMFLGLHFAAGGGGEAPGPLDFQIGLAFWTFVIFLVTMWALNRFAWRPLLRQIEDREKTIADDLAKARSLKAEIEELHAKHEARLQAAREEARELIEEAREEAARFVAEKMAEARDKTDAQTTEAKEAIRKAKDEALEAAAKDAEELAERMADTVMQEI